jgi:hypothetical protein
MAASRYVDLKLAIAAATAGGIVVLTAAIARSEQVVGSTDSTPRIEIRQAQQNPAPRAAEQTARQSRAS